MCKLYGVQTEMTRDEAAKIIRDKIRCIRVTEDDGLGVALNCEGKTLTWQCGEALFDAIGDDVLSIVDENIPKMVTIAIHGRSATSKNRTVEHSHPRRTAVGPLMHNGVVRPKSQLGWKEAYELDTDYLVELVNRDDIEYADVFLEGYAAILLVKDDGTLIVQNQGANLFMNIKHGEVEFGTTQALCMGGNKFEDMRAEVKGCEVWVKPLGVMGGRTVFHQKYSGVTNKTTPEPEKKIQVDRIQTTTGQDTPKTQAVSGSKFRSPEEQKKRNKKGKSRFLTSTSSKTTSEPKIGEHKIAIGGKIVSLREYLGEDATKEELEIMAGIDADFDMIEERFSA